ncbi:MAG: methyltransferase domain-containing protein [Pseudodesulfovibrio sp.]|nr:methyltransferase domain-containing protein [Pseudodesulfovibrio sp.]
MIHVAPEQSLSTILRQLFEDRYYTMDLFTDADIRGDLCEMPFGTDSIDIFMANHVLEHIKDDLRAMREIYRILKPQGSALLQIPIDLSLAVTEEAPEKAPPQDLLKLFGQEDHVRQYGTDFKDRLEQSGFTVRTHICHDIITPDEIKTYGLHSDEIVWEAFKS